MDTIIDREILLSSVISGSANNIIYTNPRTQFDILEYMLSLTLLLLIFDAAAALNCTGKPTTSRELRELWMGENYDKFTRPNIALWAQGDLPGDTAPPDQIYWLLQLNSIMDVDTKSQTLDVELWIRTMWFDPRIAHDSSCIQEHGASFDGSELANLWTPQTYTTSLASSGKVERSSFWIYDSGFVWWTRKVFWKLKCPMDFTYMPYDTQVPQSDSIAFCLVSVSSRACLSSRNASSLSDSHDITGLSHHFLRLQISCHSASPLVPRRERSLLRHRRAGKDGVL